MQQPCPQVWRFPCFCFDYSLHFSHLTWEPWNSLWLPPLSSPHLLLPNTGHFLSLSALISTILDQVWVGTVAYMFLWIGSQPPVSPLCRLVHKLWEDLFMLCLQFWTNLNGIFTKYPSGSRPLWTLMFVKWSAFPPASLKDKVISIAIVSGLHPGWCLRPPVAFSQNLHPLMGVPMDPRRELLT